MKIDLSGVIVSLTGLPMKMSDAVDAKDLTAKDACINAILNEQTEEDKRADGNTKFKKYKLAKKIDKAVDVVELEAEEITLIKAQLPKTYVSLVVGQVFELLEAAQSPKPAAVKPVEVTAPQA